MLLCCVVPRLWASHTCVILFYPLRPSFPYGHISHPCFTHLRKQHGIGAAEDTDSSYVVTFKYSWQGVVGLAGYIHVSIRWQPLAFLESFFLVSHLLLSSLSSFQDEQTPAVCRGMSFNHSMQNTWYLGRLFSFYFSILPFLLYILSYLSDRTRTFSLLYFSYLFEPTAGIYEVGTQVSSKLLFIILP